MQEAEGRVFLVERVAPVLFLGEAESGGDMGWRRETSPSRAWADLDQEGRALPQ